ncbi:MAG: dethiobiotin synthase [Chitinispirillales bacterium]|jgi:dethiobiotin synthetase|nr:dethiobiotin synthase [Chitinispirillales bacterium]
MAKGVFVTGSGTGVGKTYVSALLIRGFSALGHRVTYMKPVETGCSGFGLPGGALIGDTPAGDASVGDVLADGVSTSNVSIGADTHLALGLTSCKSGDISLHSPYRFAPACSPHLAAREANCRIDIGHIVLAYEKLAKSAAADVVIVEGAGGVLAPISDNEYMIDVMRALRIPAILVVEPSLGTLNHTFMSLRELGRSEVDVVGVVINNACGINRDYIYNDNAASIRRYVGSIPCLDFGHGGINNDCDGINEDRCCVNKNYGGINKTQGIAVKEFCNELAKRI